MTDPDHRVTALLRAWAAGDEQALADVTPLVYGELRKIARVYMAHERAEHTLQPTALISEAYLRLVGMRRPSLHDRTHFYALAAQIMRRILVDNARARRYHKRGGQARRVTLSDVAAGPARGQDVLQLDEALRALSEVDPRKARIVEMRYFAGLGVEEIAAVLRVSTRTVNREWNTARVWLLRELRR